MVKLSFLCLYSQQVQDLGNAKTFSLTKTREIFPYEIDAHFILS